MVNVTISAPQKRKAGGGYGGTSYARLGKARKAGSMRAHYSKAAKPGVARAVGYYGRYAGAGGPTRGGELKFHDIDWNENAADLTAGKISNTDSLVKIGQGITESLRIGRKCVIKNIGWRGKLLFGAQAAAVISPAQTIRLMVVFDSQANGAKPDVSGSGGVLESANYQSFNNLVNKGRYIVVFDKVFQFNPIAAAGDGTANDTGAIEKNFTFFKKCNIVMEYSGVANPAAITELRTNNIFGLIISSTSATDVTLDSKFRFRFSDG